jgi:hypothetical protein
VISCLGLASCFYVWAGDAARWIDFEFPADSPVLVNSFRLGPTRAHVQGTSMALDLHALVVLRNTGAKPIAGLTLRVEAPGLSSAGKGSVTIPSLHAQPGDSFPVHIDMQVRRPFSSTTNNAVLKISLDCALFSDLSAYGPDTLGSHRALMVYELEARRDRQYVAYLLETGRLAELRRELNFGLQDFSPVQLGLALLHDGNTRLIDEQAVQVGAFSFPDAPVEAIGGAARVYHNQVNVSKIRLFNRSKKTVRSVDMGWIIRDEQGREFVAGTLPAITQIGPVAAATTSESETMRFSHLGGEPMSIAGLVTFVNTVEFSDGKLWIPTRADIDAATSDPILRRQLAASPEQQRLADIYRKNGLAGLERELIADKQE